MSRPVMFLVSLWGVLFLSGGSAWGEYAPKGRRDPFVPLLTSEGQRIHPPGGDEEVTMGVSGLVLQGIVFDPQAESYAIFNGRIVRQQDEIDGMKILKIEPNAVTILVEGHSHRLTLRQPKEEKETP